METSVEESRSSTIRPPMAHHTKLALALAYLSYLSKQTGISPEKIGNHFYCETGSNPERDPDRFRKWAGQKVYVMDQLRNPPFPSEEDA